jgi:hypothetical protein
MKRSRLVFAALTVLGLAAWRASAWIDSESDPAPAPGGGNRRGARGPGALDGDGDGDEPGAPSRRAGMVTISGTVVDATTSEGVGGVEVVFRGGAGEETVIAGSDGAYRISVPAGAYRAFVRDDAVLSVGDSERTRLPGPPSADTAGAPDEALMPLVVARADARGVDLTVAAAGVIRGKVIDGAGRPIAGAVLEAQSRGPRPVLGTDVAETGADGEFELRVPAGSYFVEVSHARFAGVAGDRDAKRVAVEAGEVQTATFTLAAGCVIAGRVLGPGGVPSGEGSLERKWGTGDGDFSTTGRIEADGTFRWTTTEEAEVELRAWPWGAPPSPARSFACHDGARYEGVVLALPVRAPDLDGVLVDAGGAPVAHATIDVASLEGGAGQLERTDAQGRWRVYQLEAGRYRITAYAPGRGVVAEEVTAPRAQVRLQLGGTGRLVGRTPRLASGSFELELKRCSGEESSIRLPTERRLVAVIDHAFVIDDAPACDVEVVATWHGRTAHGDAEIPAGGDGQIELAVGPPPAVLVRGTVTDGHGRPVEGVEVKATIRGEAPAVATTDAAGRYTLHTFAGASLTARKEIGDDAYSVHTRIAEENENGEEGGAGQDREREETVDLRLFIGHGDDEEEPEPAPAHEEPDEPEQRDGPEEG